MNHFIQYNNVLLDGLQSNTKFLDIVGKKQDLLQNVLDHYDLDNNKVLFVGFSPWCLAFGPKHFHITQVSDEVLNFLRQNNCNFTFLNEQDLVNSKKIADITVACDEYFTFADSDNEQRSLVDRLAAVTNKIIITTLRDYKNQDFKEREFSQPIMIRGQNSNKIFLEHYSYDQKDKNGGASEIYVINNGSCQVHGPFARRNMYFKQLAKFSMDAGASNFYVHKNIMYKSIIKKNYEHVITIKF